MKAIRPLLLILVFGLLMVFMFQNAWLHESQSIRYDLPFLLPLAADVPNWALVLSAFLVGYVLAWTVGRIDLFSNKSAARKARKRVTELENELAEEREKNLTILAEQTAALQAAKTSHALDLADPAKTSERENVDEAPSGDTKEEKGSTV